MFCSACGTELVKEDKFCFKCGSQVGDERTQRIRNTESAVSPGYTEAVPVSNVRTEVSQKYAGFWVRFGAFVIDSLLWGVFAVSVVFLPIEESLLGLIGIVVPWLYYAMLESSSWQGTIGKLVCGIQVTDSEGNRISFIRASFRYVFHIFSSILLIGYIMAAFTQRKQALHDFMANTTVQYK
ncbi:RDD family protein [Sporosarcina sp. ACRSL]|uniref:RDD family protein n=1 Tax=Sporosarcina sp. ACRSL TaxID=2918215 RepID=UPI002104AD28|nr:RDD family protein [Sporosarcina sp. ACRSL]MCG7344070.1 RDD family protein [Sporosarcina sp. ACRSL]